MIERAYRWLPFGLLALALVWYLAVGLRFHTYGAIGTDPPTYVQMGLDLAARGTPRHEFSLFNNLYTQGFSWDALLPPGYRVATGTGAIVPTFAFGLPLLLALADMVGGSRAAEWVAPLLGLLALVATYGLSNELLREMPTNRRRTISALAVLLLGAAAKQIELALVPMSDVPTQLFCVLALWCALRVRRGGNRASLGFAVLTGLSLGLAYLMRHSALIMLAPLGVVMWRWGQRRRGRVVLLLAAGIALGLTMAPDLIYRAQVFGSPFAVESADSTQVVLKQAPQQFLGMLVALVSVTGFGPIVLLAPVGWWSLWRSRFKWQAAILIVWVGVFMAFHAPLFLTGVFENNLRYLIPTYPALALSIAIGTVGVVERATMMLARHEITVRVVGLGLLIVILIGVGIAIRTIAGPQRFVARAYGWMSATARSDFESLKQTLPPNAIVGTSDQMAGPVLLYTGREVFRPGSMVNGANEFSRFVSIAGATQPIFVLGDWNCAPDAAASDKLPIWMAGQGLQDTGIEIHDLPYECAQRLYRVAKR